MLTTDVVEAAFAFVLIAGACAIGLIAIGLVGIWRGRK